jgi:hypothetical protein
MAESIIVFVFSVLITVGFFSVLTFAYVVPLLNASVDAFSNELETAILRVTEQSVAGSIQEKNFSYSAERDITRLMNLLAQNVTTVSVNTVTNTSTASVNTNTASVTVNTSTINTNTNTNTASASVEAMLSSLTSVVGGTPCTTGQYYANGVCVTPTDNTKLNPLLTQNLQTVVHDIVTLVANTL